MQDEAQVGNAETQDERRALPGRVRSLPSSKCRYSPPFPALPTTLIELEFLLGAQSVDLKRLVSVVRSDPGFTAEVLRLTRRYEDQRPLSLETCLIHLGTRKLGRAARRVPVWIQPLSDSESSKFRRCLRRTRFVALAAEAISAWLGDISSETAYLAGLMHDLPALLCLGQGCGCSVTEIVPSLEGWNLPDYLVETMRWHRRPIQSDPKHFQVTQRVAVARAWASEMDGIVRPLRVRLDSECSPEYRLAADALSKSLPAVADRNVQRLALVPWIAPGHSAQ